MGGRQTLAHISGFKEYISTKNGVLFSRTGASNETNRGS